MDFLYYNVIMILTKKFMMLPADQDILPVP